jgi:hypothetical protein
MSTAPGSALAGPVPGVVKITLAGSPFGLDVLTAILSGLRAVEILTGPDGPHPDRRAVGERVYLTVRIGTPDATADQRGASAQPPSDPLAPLPHRRHLP